MTFHSKSSRTGKTLTRVCVGLGLVGACTVVDKGDYTFTDNPDATGGEDSGGTGGSRGGAAGSGGNSGTNGIAGEGGEATGGSGGRGGTGGSTAGDGGGGTGGAGDGCEPNPCEHDGVCTSSAGVVTCDCAPGYEGDTCGDEIDECDPNPCLGMVECIDRLADFECVCPPSVTGKKCELARFETIEVGPRSYARAVSADGTIVLGSHFNGDGMERPYYWSTGNMPELAAVPSDLRTNHVTPLALSGDGTLWVGQTQNTMMAGAPIMSAGGTRTQFGNFRPPTTAVGAAIVDTTNDGTKSVGWVDDGSNIGVHAFTWDTSGRPSPLPPPMVAMMSQYYVAGAVTRDGHIITGSVREPMGGNWYVVGWSYDPASTPPPPTAQAPGGTLAVAVHGVREDGRMSAGTYRDAAQVSFAFVTDQTRFHVIAPMIGTMNATSNAWDISDDGATIVGDVDSSGMTGGMGLQAVVWRGPQPSVPQYLEAMLRNLNVDLRGCTLKTAYGVSADGTVIVGEASSTTVARLGFIARLPAPQ